MHTSSYLFKSERLGFRNWRESDQKILAEINSDPVVMHYFPAVKSENETKTFIEKMQKQFSEKGFCYFAVDELEKGELIGFIGLSEQTFESDFTPCIDIGWRLKKEEWNKGFATEGAKGCLDYAFHHLSKEKIVSIAPKINSKSETIMVKIGMKKVKYFQHPLLKENKELEECVLYEICKQ